MRYCAFGARMLGEVAHTICEMVTAKDKPMLIYSGMRGCAARIATKKICLEIGGVAESCCRRSTLGRKARGENVIVVGAFSERNAEAIYKKPARAIFINPFDMARPGQIRDGYFPDAVFADPRYVMPVIYAALDEWINGKGRKRGSIGSLLSGLARFGGLAAQVARGAKALEAMVHDKNCVRFLTDQRRDDRRQDGSDHLRHDRAGDDSRDLIDGRADGARSGLVDRAQALQVQSQIRRYRARPAQTQSRHRHFGAGDQSRYGRRSHRQSDRKDRRQRDAQPDGAESS